MIGLALPEAAPPDPSSGGRGSEASERGCAGRGQTPADSPDLSQRWW